MTVVGIIGYNGLLGFEIFKHYAGRVNQLIGITRNNYHQQKDIKYDVLINANGNSKKFWASQNIIEDFEASTLSVYKSVLDFDYNKYIYISTVDAEDNHPYGFNKSLSEQIVRQYCPNYIILRATALLGKGLTKGLVNDILHNNKLFVTKESALQYITTKEVARIIEAITPTVNNETLNMGGKNPVSVPELAKLLGKNIDDIEEGTQHQYYDVDVSPLDKVYKLKNSYEYVEDFIKEKT